MISLSTAWFENRGLSTAEALAETRRLGFGAIEWGISDLNPDADTVAAAVASGEIVVSSLHALAGFNQQVGLDPRGSHLCSADARLRRLSIDGLRRTIALGRRLKARAVVTHAGTLEGPVAQRVQALVRYYEHHGDTPDFRRELVEIGELRRQVAPAGLERTIKALEEVFRKEGDFPVGIECHYYYSSLPLPEEFEQIVAAVDRPCLGYWHDCGHARMMQIFAGVPEMSWLERFRDRLRGVHIHDMIKTRDHRPPGTGELDLAGVARRIAGCDCVRVMEIAGTHPADGIVAGRLHLESLGLS